jgi:hypothetical protein
MYSLHGLLALIRPRRAGVPRVDRRVVLHARVGAPPRGVRDVVPQLLRVERLRDLAVVRNVVVQVSPSSSASKNASGIRTELLEFCPLTVVVRLAVEVVVERQAQALAVSPMVSLSRSLAFSPAIFFSPRPSPRP